MQQRPQANYDRIFHALAEPHRRRFVEMLSRGPASVKDLAEPMGVRLPAVLKHLRVLEDGGLVVSEKVGRVRTYRMSADPFHAISGWIEERQAELNRAFDRLAAAMAATPEKKDN
jgi:DNA-binding transcriptional ArsR family regulator